MIKVEDGDWGSPTDQNTCECGNPTPGDAWCADCRDDYEATIDWERR